MSDVALEVYHFLFEIEAPDRPDLPYRVCPNASIFSGGEQYIGLPLSIEQSPAGDVLTIRATDALFISRFIHAGVIVTIRVVTESNPDDVLAAYPARFVPRRDSDADDVLGYLRMEPGP